MCFSGKLSPRDVLYVVHEFIKISHQLRDILDSHIKDTKSAIHTFSHFTRHLPFFSNSFPIHKKPMADPSTWLRKAQWQFQSTHGKLCDCLDFTTTRSLPSYWNVLVIPLISYQSSQVYWQDSSYLAWWSPLESQDRWNEVIERYIKIY
jgi:hypothetical protein